MMKLNEQVAVLTALQKMVKARLDEVRAEADEALLADFAEDGVTKKALKLSGIKVGDYLVVLNSGKWAVTDTETFNDFALTYGFADVTRAIRPEYMNQAIEMMAKECPEAISESVKLDPKWENWVENVAGVPTFMDSGLTVPGIEYTGQTVKGTQVRGCKPEDVGPIIAKLGGVDALLLGEPNDKQLTTPEEG